jgi:probable phosphoglycerate mutase
VQTAAPLGRAYAIAPLIDPRLAEYELGCGALDAVVERPDLLIWRPEHQGVAGGEPLRAFAARIAAFCDAVVARHVGGWVAVVTHAGTIDAALRWAVGCRPRAPGSTSSISPPPPSPNWRSGPPAACPAGRHATP